MKHSGQESLQREEILLSPALRSLYREDRLAYHFADIIGEFAMAQGRNLNAFGDMEAGRRAAAIRLQYITHTFADVREMEPDSVPALSAVELLEGFLKCHRIGSSRDDMQGLISMIRMQEETLDEWCPGCADFMCQAIGCYYNGN